MSFESGDYIFNQIDPNRKMFLDQPLMYSMTANGNPKYKHSNSLGMLFLKLKKQLNLSIPMKHLRKTAASHMLEVSGNDLIIVQQFLGHTPKTIAEKHYARTRDNTKLEAGINMMYDSLGIGLHIDVLETAMEDYQRKMKW